MSSDDDSTDTSDPGPEDGNVSSGTDEDGAVPFDHVEYISKQFKKMRVTSQSLVLDER